MSKPALFGVLFLWLFMLTYLVTAVVDFDAGSGLVIDGTLSVFESQEGVGTIQMFGNMLRVFWSALTFQIEGLPVIMTLFFLVPSAINGYMILSFVRGGS